MSKAVGKDQPKGGKGAPAVPTVKFTDGFKPFIATLIPSLNEPQLDLKLQKLKEVIKEGSRTKFRIIDKEDLSQWSKDAAKGDVGKEIAGITEGNAITALGPEALSKLLKLRLVSIKNEILAQNSATQSNENLNEKTKGKDAKAPIAKKPAPAKDAAKVDDGSIKSTRRSGKLKESLSIEKEEPDDGMDAYIILKDFYSIETFKSLCIDGDIKLDACIEMKDMPAVSNLFVDTPNLSNEDKEPLNIPAELLDNFRRLKFDPQLQSQFKELTCIKISGKSAKQIFEFYDLLAKELYDIVEQRGQYNQFLASPTSAVIIPSFTPGLPKFQSNKTPCTKFNEFADFMSDIIAVSTGTVEQEVNLTGNALVDKLVESELKRLGLKEEPKAPNPPREAVHELDQLHQEGLDDEKVERLLRLLRSGDFVQAVQKLDTMEWKSSYNFLQFKSLVHNECAELASKRALNHYTLLMEYEKLFGLMDLLKQHSTFGDYCWTETLDKDTLTQALQDAYLTHPEISAKFLKTENLLLLAFMQPFGLKDRTTMDSRDLFVPTKSSFGLHVDWKEYKKQKPTMMTPESSVVYDIQDENGLIHAKEKISFVYPTDGAIIKKVQKTSLKNSQVSTRLTLEYHDLWLSTENETRHLLANWGQGYTLRMAKSASALTLSTPDGKYIEFLPNGSLNIQFLSQDTDIQSMLLKPEGKAYVKTDKIQVLYANGHKSVYGQDLSYQGLTETGFNVIQKGNEMEATFAGLRTVNRTEIKTTTRTSIREDLMTTIHSLDHVIVQHPPCSLKIQSWNRGKRIMMYDSDFSVTFDLEKNRHSIQLKDSVSLFWSVSETGVESIEYTSAAYEFMFMTNGTATLRTNAGTSSKTIYDLHWNDFTLSVNDIIHKFEVNENECKSIEKDIRFTESKPLEHDSLSQFLLTNKFLVPSNAPKLFAIKHDQTGFQILSHADLSKHLRHFLQTKNAEIIEDKYREDPHTKILTTLRKTDNNGPVIYRQFEFVEPVSESLRDKLLEATFKYLQWKDKYGINELTANSIMTELTESYLEQVIVKNYKEYLLRQAPKEDTNNVFSTLTLAKSRLPSAVKSNVPQQVFQAKFSWSHAIRETTPKYFDSPEGKIASRNLNKERNVPKSPKAKPSIHHSAFFTTEKPSSPHPTIKFSDLTIKKQSIVGKGFSRPTYDLKIFEHLQVLPMNGCQFGHLKEGEKYTLHLTLRNVGSEMTRFKTLPSQHPNVTVETKRCSLAPGIKTTIEVTLNAEGDGQEMTDIVDKISLVNDHKTIHIPLSATIVRHELFIKNKYQLQPHIRLAPVSL